MSVDYFLKLLYNRNINKNGVDYMRKITILILIISIIASAAIVFADNTENITVSLGETLTEQEKADMLSFFGVDESVRIVPVTNAEEYEYFGDFVDASLIGSNAISCAYVEKMPKGHGITVEKTDNIHWVTEDMYKNACVTAGIEDAKIIVSSPTRASGTAALTGIIKAFEEVSGEEITEEEKRTASEEIVRTAELGDSIGKEKAEELINNIKVNIINNNITNKVDIEKVVIQVAENLNISLTQEQIEQITSLMENVSKLDLNVEQIKGQLKDIAGKIDQVLEDNIEVRSLLERILDAITNFFRNLFG